MEYPSWLIPLHHAVDRVVEHRQCSRADTEWDLREQIAHGAIQIALVDKRLCPHPMGPNEWRREAPRLLRTGTTLSYGRFHDGNGTKVWAFLHKEVLDALLGADSPNASVTAATDDDLVAEVRALVESGLKVRTATLKVAEKAAGAGTLDSRARRLSRKYTEMYKAT